MRPISHPDDDEWEFEVKRRYDDDVGRTLMYLDADPCPNCGSKTINAQIIEGVQFVGASGRSQDRFTDDDREIKNSLYQADDGPFFEGLRYARCGSCQTVLYDDE